MFLYFKSNLWFKISSESLLWAPQ